MIKKLIKTIFGFLSVGGIVTIFLALPFGQHVYAIWQHKREVNAAEKQYPLLGFRFEDRIVEKVISYDALCKEEFSGRSINGKLFQIWDRLADGSIALSTENDTIFSKGLTSKFDLKFLTNDGRKKYYGFDREKVPISCSPDISLLKMNEVVEGQLLRVNGLCERRALAYEMLVEKYGELEVYSDATDFFPIEQRDIFPTSSQIEVRKNFEASCQLLISKVSDCFNFDQSVEAEYISQRRYKEEQCEHPDHEQFRKELLRKWEDLKFKD